MFLVYKISNSINNKLYFGITKCSLQKRWNEHKCLSKSPNTFLKLAIKKYGVYCFKMELVKSCETEDEMYLLEKELILIHKSNNRFFGYNNSTGGECSSKGKMISEITKLKISESQKNRLRKPHSQETKNKIGNSNKGNIMSDSQKIQISKTMKNRTPWNKGIKQKDYVKK